MQTSGQQDPHAADGPPRVAVGLMAGNSLDGIGTAVVETAGTGFHRSVRLLGHDLHELPSGLRAELLAFGMPAEFDAERLLAAHLAMAEELAAAARAAIAGLGIEAADVDVVGVHGANLVHAAPRPGAKVSAGHMEIGELAVVAERTGTVVVGDLRPSDVACGGAGAPLSPFVDFLLFGGIDGRSRAIQNLGGIANVTLIPAGAGADETLSFDCGPGNSVIDRVVSHVSDGRELFDRDGRRAARGTVDAELLARLLDHPYFGQEPPKTSGPEQFGDEFVAELLADADRRGLAGDDLVATATQLTVDGIAGQYERFFPALPDEVVLTGGGARNLELVARLAARLPATAVRLHDEYGIPVEAREAVTWAVLADETLHGRAAGLPAATGAAAAAVLGKIAVPSCMAGRLRIARAMEAIA